MLLLFVTDVGLLCGLSFNLPVPLQECHERNEWDFEKITLTDSKSNANPHNNTTSKVIFTVFKVILHCAFPRERVAVGNNGCKFRKNR